MDPSDVHLSGTATIIQGTSSTLSPPEALLSPGIQRTESNATSREDEEDSSNAASSDCKSPGQRTKSNQRWMKLRTTVQLSSAIQKKPPLKREDSFLKRFSTRQIPETQETVEDTGSEGATGEQDKTIKRRKRYIQKRKSVVNPDENFYFHWLMVLTFCVLYNMWALIVRQSFPELQDLASNFWFACDCISDVVFVLDVVVQLRTGYLEQGLMVYDDKKLAKHYIKSREFLLDLAALIPLDLLQIKFGTQPLLRFPRFFKVYRSIKFYYIVESRTVWPNLWRVVNLIHILLILAHWFGCFYFLLSEVEGFQGDWVYPYRPGDYATLTRKYLGSLYWSTLTLTTIGDLPTPETNAEPSDSADGPRSLPRRGLKSRLLQFGSNNGYIFTIVSYLIGVFIFATIVGQVGNVITNRNANRLEFERLLDGAKTYMRHHKVPGGMKRRVLRWYDYSWSRGRIQGGGDINTALGLLPDKLKTELALHVNLSVLKKVTIFQECQPEFLHDLVLKMKAYIFTPGDMICRKGEVAREMFIIADGILEVLSETGKVLTTMKAGDFFGEIGILNLDGLNKRTADVRSVGYSELFSLSREDVLAAMKDYPEAQEILQTLGRKRLMEVRCVNKKHAKMQSDREAAAAAAAAGDSSENSASKRIVEKLRSDVKGIKNVLRKSRTGRRSNESIELQPLHTGTSSSGSSKTPKGVLRRMPRVKSDDMVNEEDHPPPEKSPSPIGAGLPLLARLRLLKEKQDREERAVKAAPPMIVSSHTHVKSTVSPQESIQEEPEPEVIGAGLPLLQRLKLLKAKEDKIAKDKIAKENQAKSPLATIQSTISVPATSSSAGSSILSTAPSIKQITNIPTPSTCLANPSPLPKPTLKVSFKDRIKALQGASTTPTEPKISEKEENQSQPTTESGGDSMKQQLLPSATSIIITKISKPSTSLSLKEKIKSSLGGAPKEEPLKPWSKLKLATVVSSGGSYTSLNNSFTEESPTSSLPRPTTSSTRPIATPTVAPTRPTDWKFPIKAKVKSKECRASVSDSEQSISSQPKTKSFKVQRKPKNYRSVDDLSPEYSGLPFVKKLKILNERQKLAELEHVIQTRSFSLDCPEAAVTPVEEPLTRSRSEASGMARGHGMKVSGPPANVPINELDYLHTPLSPESNETLERRHLKSILKRMTEDGKSKESDEAVKTEDEEGIIRAPTMEGPPHSASSLIEATPPVDQTFFPSTPPCAQTPQDIPQVPPSPAPLPPTLTTTTITKSPTAPTKEDTHETSSNGRIVREESQELPDHGKLISADSPYSLSKQRKFFKGSLEDQEYFGEVLLGVRQVIQNHLRDVQSKFQDKFYTMEAEIQKRDDIINQLQSRIAELEGHGEGLPMTPIGEVDREGGSSGSGGSSASSIELPFMVSKRGDSLDTIFASSPPSELERRPKCRMRKRNSPKHRSERTNNRSWEESSDQESIEMQELPRSLSPYRQDVLVQDITGNLTRISADSVILNIEDSSASYSSSEVDGPDDEDDDETRDEELHCDDWEIRMLAAEMDRREQSESALTVVAEASTSQEEEQTVRRRRKRSETDTEPSEHEMEVVTSRPRAGSLDHHNLRRAGFGSRSKSVFKAMSFDRDKDRL
ncbi:pneumococcal serine-rich repeat protein isoform X1 [Sergentomyia squamirostris]